MAGFRFALIFVVCSVATPSSHANLVITEVVDGTIFSFAPRFVEVTNLGPSSVNLDQFSINVFYNGATTAATIVPLSGALTSGDSYVVSFEGSGDSPGESEFFRTYGFDPDNFLASNAFNGDDAIALFHSSSTTTPTDVYGVIGQDGTNRPWEYTDGHSFRNPSVSAPTATFEESEWTFGGVNSLEAANDAAERILIVQNTTPGSFVAVPEPSAFLFGSLICCVLGANSRRRR